MQPEDKKISISYTSPLTAGVYFVDGYDMALRKDAAADGGFSISAEVRMRHTATGATHILSKGFHVAQAQSAIEDALKNTAEYLRMAQVMYLYPTRREDFIQEMPQDVVTMILTVQATAPLKYDLSVGQVKYALANYDALQKSAQEFESFTGRKIDDPLRIEGTQILHLTRMRNAWQPQERGCLSDGLLAHYNAASMRERMYADDAAVEPDPVDMPRLAVTTMLTHMRFSHHMN